MCGDICCPSCGPAQGNSRCPICGSWASDGPCPHVNDKGELKDEFVQQVIKAQEAEDKAMAEAYEEEKRFWEAHEWCRKHDRVYEKSKGCPDCR